MVYVALVQVFLLSSFAVTGTIPPQHTVTAVLYNTRLAHELRCVQSDSQLFISLVNQHQGQWRKQN